MHKNFLQKTLDAGNHWVIVKSEAKDEPMRTQKLQDKFQELVEWLEHYDCDVCHTSFKRACSELLGAACTSYGIARPIVSYGVTELSVACSLIGVYMPALIISSNLPGAQEYRRLLDA